jgi:hypothetical protein
MPRITADSGSRRSSSLRLTRAVMRYSRLLRSARATPAYCRPW